MMTMGSGVNRTPFPPPSRPAAAPAALSGRERRPGGAEATSRQCEQARSGIAGSTCATWHTQCLDKRRVEQSEEIAQRALIVGVQPAPTPMLGRVVDHVASLAERSQVARRIVSRIMVQVRARDIDPRHADDGGHCGNGCAHPPTAAVTPMPAIGIPPSAVTQMEYASPMRTPTMLAAPLGAAEPDQPRQLGPVDGVQPAMFGHDRHDESMSQQSRERKQKLPLATGPREWA